MKRFSFRLQRILDIREQFRDEARQELGRRNAELKHQESILSELRAELARLRPGLDGIVTAGELLLTDAYALRIHKLMEQQFVKIEEARRAVVVAQEKYIQANREAKALEMLKAKKKEVYDQEALREEINQLDEIAIQRAGAKE